MPNGVLFDFDGVVVDSHPVHTRAWKQLLATVGRDTSEEELQFILDGRKRDDIFRYFLGDLTPSELDSLGFQKERLFQEHAAQVKIVDGLLEFLGDLEKANVALGIASSGSRSRVGSLLKDLGLENYFQVIVTGDEVDRGKPDPAVFLKAARNLGMRPFEFVVFEDAISGVKAARSAGMRCIGIAKPDRASVFLDAGATHVEADFRSLSYSRLHEICSG